MSAIRNILARRDAIRAEMRSIHDAHPDTLPAEAQTRWTALEAEAEALNGQERRQAALDDLDRRAAGQTVAGTGDDRFDTEARRFSLARAIAAQIPGSTVDAGREREISAEVCRRAGRQLEGIAVPMAVFEKRVTSPAGTGGSVVATNLDAGQFINRLYAATRTIQLGATLLPGLVGNVDIPRLAGSTAAGWVADNSPLTASDPAFDKVSLHPHTAGILSEFSRNMLLQSTPAIEELMRADMARMLAITLDLAAVAGTGASNQPTGVLNTTGIGSVALGTNGAALGYDNVVDLMGQVQDQNAETGGLAFLTNYKVRRAVQKIKTTTAEPLGEAVVFQGMPRAFTTGVPSTLTKGTGTGLSAMVYANWSDLLIGVWDQLSILVNPFEVERVSKGQRAGPRPDDLRYRRAARRIVRSYHGYRGVMLPPGVDPQGVNTLVAFGSLAGVGAAAPVTATGTAPSCGAFFAWGAWGSGTQLLLESSADAGVTWTLAEQFDGSAMSPYQDAVPAGVSKPGLYRVRLDVPFPGGVVNWAFYQ